MGPMGPHEAPWPLWALRRHCSVNAAAPEHHHGATRWLSKLSDVGGQLLLKITPDSVHFTLYMFVLQLKLSLVFTFD